MKLLSWYGLALLALASYRTWWLLSQDTILDKPRRYVTRLDSKWEKEGDPTGKHYRAWLGQLIDCPWCLGFWVSVAWWGLWEAWPHWTIIVSVPFAISCLVGLIHRTEKE